METHICFHEQCTYWTVHDATVCGDEIGLALEREDKAIVLLLFCIKPRSLYFNHYCYKTGVCVSVFVGRGVVIEGTSLRVCSLSFSIFLGQLL